jgi:hypothetical protein
MEEKKKNLPERGQAAQSAVDDEIRRRGLGPYDGMDLEDLVGQLNIAHGDARRTRAELANTQQAVSELTEKLRQFNDRCALIEEALLRKLSQRNEVDRG